MEPQQKFAGIVQEGPSLVLFGAPAFIDGGQFHALQMSEKTLALLTLLACHAERPVSRAWLASILWPDVDEVEARTNLRRHFYKLAKALPAQYGDPVKLTKNTAQWNPHVGFTVDAIAFAQAVAAGRARDAVALYGGPLCVASFDDAVAEQRDRFEQLYFNVLHGEIENARSAEDKPREIGLLQLRAAADQLNESWVCDLAQAQLDCGDRASAQRELSALAARLRSELQVEPQTRTLQLLASCIEKPNLGNSTTLPVEVDSLVGREREIQELGEVLRSNSWVTLTGPAGIGKTRLAVRVARNHLFDFPDGVWFVDLTSTTTWDDAITQLVALLNIAVSGDDVLHALRTFLLRRRILLVLDNCEQLDEAVGNGIAQLVDAASTTVLATSRRPLGGDGETVYAIKQLSVPPLLSEPSAALGYAAVRLFVERASAVAPAFALSHENVPHVTSIVGRLDGLPLAIELIAARMNVLRIEGIAKRLDDLDRFPLKDRSGRHQTLAAAIRWSYELLAPRERLLLDRLSVFEGPFDLPAIESICSDECDMPKPDVFVHLSELVEASLVVSISSEDGDQRYGLLETLRRFLRALPGAFGEDIRAAHAAYFAQVVRETERAYDEIGTGEYVARTRRDRANIEAALRYAWEARDATMLSVFLCGLCRLWIPAEVQRLAHIVDFLSQEDVIERLALPERARLLFALAGHTSTDADWPRTKALRERAAACWRELGEEFEALRADIMIAFAESYMGVSLKDVIVPRLYAIDGRLAQIAAPKWQRGRLKYNLASMELSLGNAQKALGLVLESLAIFRTDGRIDNLASCLVTLAKIYIDLGELQLAERCVEESVAILGDPGFAVWLARAYGLRAALQLKSGDPGRALVSCAQSLRQFEGAFELRFVAQTIDSAMRALVEMGRANCAARIAGYLLERARTTGSVALATSFENSQPYRDARAALGESFGVAEQLGATYTFPDVCAQVEIEAAAASETSLAYTPA